LGKAKNAISDFDLVLDMKPDFTAARISRGNIHLKQANFDLAQLDFYNVVSTCGPRNGIPFKCNFQLKTDPYNQEASDLIGRIDPTKERLRLAEFYYGHDDYINAINLLSEVLETSPWAAQLYELRSEMHMANGDEMAAVSDIRSATKLQSDNTEGYYKLSQLLYKLGHATDSLKSIRECLKLDPEHKDCFPFYKKIKKVEKFLTEAETSMEEKSYQQCIDAALKVLKNENEVHNIIYNAKRLLCACYSNDEQTSEAISACTEALAINDDPNIYCDRAEAYLQSEMYDDAIRDFKAALEMNSQFDRAREGLTKAENRQKQSERRDYYKILDVKRTASKKEIVKAYRNLAQKWHPDNYHTDEKMKKIAEKKFIDIAAAKEVKKNVLKKNCDALQFFLKVLTDDEKRRQFDNGEDPLDPESGRGGMPNFHQFHTFHGSPFQFKFHFN
jgi:DnaJ family protein C protein 3